MFKLLIHRLTAAFPGIKVIKFIKNNIAEIIRFGVSGLLVLSSYAISFYLLAKYAANINIFVINGLAYVISCAFSFVLHKYFSFRRKSKVEASEVIRFLLVVTFSYLISNITVYLVAMLGMRYYFIIALNGIIIPIVNYILMKFFTFIKP